MTRNLFAACILSLAFASVGSAQSTVSAPETGVQYSQSQVKELARNARDPEQFKALARYYAERQLSYTRKAREEKKEWMRRSQNVVGSSAKYPTPAESARNLYEYYTLTGSRVGSPV
jgi:cell shape-determining protein MreC